MSRSDITIPRHYSSHLVTLLFLIVSAGCGPSAEPGVADEITVRVVSYNIYHDRDDWPSRLDVIADTMETLAPDVICMQEVLQHEDLRNQAEALAERLRYHHHFTSVDGAECARRYGNAILSPHPFEETNQRVLQPLDDYRNAGHVRLNIDGQSVDVYCTHLHHLPTQEGGAIRAEQLRDLLDFIGQTASTDVVLLAGDFNAEPHYAEMAILNERFVDTYRAVFGDGDRPTTLNPHFGHNDRWIDYVFVGRESATRIDAVRRVLAAPVADTLWGSDHFAVMADVRVPR